jgi:hypothetical protein
MVMEFLFCSVIFVFFFDKVIFLLRMGEDEIRLLAECMKETLTYFGQYRRREQKLLKTFTVQKQ